MSYPPRKLEISCPKCGNKTVSCTFILGGGGNGPYTFQYIHSCSSCEYREEDDDFQGCNPGPAVCTFCKHVWRTQEDVDFWLSEGF